MKTKTYNVYKFNELSEESQQKAIGRYRETSHDDSFSWDNTKEDAKQIGLILLGTERGKFIAGAEECAHLIEDNHGEACDTFKTAKAYLESRDKAIETAQRDENGDFVSEYELDRQLDELDAEFLRDICEDYRIYYEKEVEYQSSDEAIKSLFESNDYDFTLDGRID